MVVNCCFNHNGICNIAVSDVFATANTDFLAAFSPITILVCYVKRPCLNSPTIVVFFLVHRYLAADCAKMGEDVLLFGWLSSMEKLVETKYMYLYDNVVNWNDSASEEAFDNAKSRFWSEINGLPCDIPLPDPDIYIDDIDWSSTIDPELILDLERDAIVPSDKENDAEVVIIGDALLVNQSFFCIGIAIKYTKI
uniref:Uncharacterized protein LOC105851370 n=2 Tax=Cicer arietinum TaxID=3827 RepID=A0A3Q7XKB0_CICAR|nr:uncharacterized protein LOC105851370 [Cicer arietinum]